MAMAAVAAGDMPVQDGVTRPACGSDENGLSPSAMTVSLGRASHDQLPRGSPRGIRECAHGRYRSNKHPAVITAEV
jgi:hypothetical protein